MDECTVTTVGDGSATDDEQCVEEIIGTELTELRQRTPVADVERVVWCIRHDVPVNYVVDWVPFAIAYYHSHACESDLEA